MAAGKVYIVHCVDTEGPLCEEHLTLSGLTNDNVKNKTDEPRFEDFDQLVNWHRPHTLGTWEGLAEKLATVTNKEFRNNQLDSNGKGWVFNWFCMDHIGFEENPRHRAMGFHTIFDFYDSMVTEQDAGDAIYWHFHPLSIYKEGHRCARSYINSPNLYEILSRRLLEQWMPFDFSNTASDDVDPEKNKDIVGGRFSDWRWAPIDWRTYHPHHDCHQLEGSCRRKIARCLNLISRFANVTEAELEKAFQRASDGESTLVAICSHDWRDMSVEIRYFQYLLDRVTNRYPNVKYVYSEAVEAFNAVHPELESNKISLKCDISCSADGNPLRVDIDTVSGKVFGPQPYFAIKTRSRRFIHDNLCLGTEFGKWFYEFGEDAVSPDDVSVIGVAANDAIGNQSIHVLDVDALGERNSDTYSF